MIKVIKSGRDVDKDMFGIVCWNCDCEFLYQKEDIQEPFGCERGVYCPNCQKFHKHSIRNLVIKKRKN